VLFVLAGSTVAWGAPSGSKPAAESVGPFSAPATVTRSEGSRFALAVNAPGEQAFAWEASRVVSPAPRFRQQTFIRIRLRSASGKFGRTITVPHSTDGVLPSIALAPDGTAIVAWTQMIRRHIRIVVAVREPGHGLGGRRAIGRTDKFQGALPRPIFDRKGNAIVLWRRSDSLQWVRRARGHGFGRSRTLRLRPASKRIFIGEKDVVFDRKGIAYVVLSTPGAQRRLPDGRIEQTAPAGIFLSAARPGKRFGAPRPVSPPGDASNPRVAVGLDSTVAVVWRRSPIPSAEDLGGPIQAAVRRPGGGFGPAQTLSAPAIRSATNPRIAITPTGEAVAAWKQNDDEVVAASVRARGGSFGPGQTISTGPVPDRLSLAAIERGDVFAIWQQQLPSGGIAAVSSVRPVGGTFGAPEPVASGIAGLFGVASAGNRVAALVVPSFPVVQVVTLAAGPS
jgi:hypothetical protein